MKSTTLFISKQHGFSMIEMLVVISIIGIIVAMALPSMTGIASQAEFARDQRNAQTIASVAASAVASGYPATNFNSEEQAINLLTQGIEVTNNGQVMRFEVTSLSTNEQASARHFLSLTNGMLVHSTTRSQ